MTSTAALVSPRDVRRILKPWIRAGMTRVSLNTNLSPDLRWFGSLVKVESETDEPRATSSRAEERGLAGLNAIRSSGRSNWKSDMFNPVSPKSRAYRIMIRRAGSLVSLRRRRNVGSEYFPEPPRCQNRKRIHRDVRVIGGT